ncbi:MAG: RecX family transcriptional regulator [Patescibacteria group bacterium]
MIISAITQQVKRADRYSIFIDGEYSFSLSERELIASGIHSGLEISPTEVKNYKKLSQTDKVYGLVLNLIARRARSQKELIDYMRRKNLDDSEVQIILNKLSKSRLVDDLEFARRWVQNRRDLKNASNRKLHLELRVKGINSEIIDEVLANSLDDEQSALAELIEKKRRQAKYREDPQKLMAYLARQGFNYSDIKNILDFE